MSHDPQIHWLGLLVRSLHEVDTYQQLTDVLLTQAQEHLGVSTIWMYLKRPTDDAFLHLVAASGTHHAQLRELIPRLPIQGDPMLEALCRGEGPFVFDDLQTVAGLNQEVIEAMGSRAMLNAGLANVDDTLGLIGAGTFFDEGPRAMTSADVDRWMQVVALASAIAARIRIKEKESARRALAAQLAQRQRLESLGELAGGVAHDLNNLLMVIDHSVEFVLREGLNPQQQADAQTARAAVKSAADLNRQLLALGRRAPLELQPVDLRAVLVATHRLLERLLPATIHTACVVPSEPLWILGDAGSMEQVLLNLAINARDAMPDGGRLVFQLECADLGDAYRELYPWARPGRYAVVSVSDTGCGMPEEVRTRSFDPFYTTKTADQGSGLGLSVVYGIVEQHEGSIQCESEVGVATTFTIHLPLGASRTPPVAAPEAREPRGGAERILVVDDAPHIREVLRRVLSDAGYQVTTAANGQEALDCVKSFDLYLVDAVMPVLDGRKTIEALRQRDPAARILLVSGYGTEGLSIGFLRDIGVPALPKPIDPTTLLRHVRSMLDRPTTS